jgi:hypothetical protein
VSGQVNPYPLAGEKRRAGRKVQIEFDGLKMKVEEPTAEEADIQAYRTAARGETEKEIK